MNIRCNSEEVQIKATNLESALRELGYENAVVATALNGEFIPRQRRQDTSLCSGDFLDIVSPRQGG